MPAWQFIGASQGLNVARSPVLLTTSMTKTAATAAYDSGASSLETIAGDGFVEWFVTQIDKDYFVGLSKDDANQNYTSIDFGIEIAPNFGTGRHYLVYESGVQKFASAADAWNVGDVFRVERRGGSISYYRNGDWFYGSLAANQAGVLRVDTSMFSQNGTIDGLRLYDATAKAWKSPLTWQNVTTCTIAQGTAYQRRRMTFPAVAKQVVGDQLVAIIAQQGGGFASFALPADTWQFVDVLTAADHRVFCVYRRRVLSGDPANYIFDLNEVQESVGALLVYRNTDDSAALVEGSVDDIFGATDFACPKRTPTRVTDVYVGMCWKKTTAGTMTAQSDCTMRVDMSPPTTFNFCTPRLFVFDFAPDGVVQTDLKHVVASVASDGCAGSMLVAGVKPPGHGLSWLPPAPGAIGLTPEGI